MERAFIPHGKGSNSIGDDYFLSLSLVFFERGRLPYACAVAPRGANDFLFVQSDSNEKHLVVLYVSIASMGCMLQSSLDGVLVLLWCKHAKPYIYASHPHPESDPGVTTIYDGRPRNVKMAFLR